MCVFSLSTATFVEEQKEKAEKAQKMYMSDLAQIDKKSLILYYLIFYLFSMQEEGKKSFFWRGNFCDLGLPTESIPSHIAYV